MPAETYHRAFTIPNGDHAPGYVLSTDPKLLPVSPTWADTFGPLTFQEVQQLAIEWAASGDHVLIRTATTDYAYPPYGGTGRPRAELALAAFAAIGPDSFVAAMVEEPFEELPF